MGLTTLQVAWADTTSSGATTNSQTNTSGSNTTISGGYSQESTTTYQSGSSSNTTSTTNNNSYSGDTRVTSQSSAPSMSAMSQDLCVVGMSAGVSTFGLGVSGGTYTTDENCERIKLSKVLNDLGMKVAAVSILCQDPRVFFAMEQSGTPCPFEGKIGKAATQQWKKYNKLRPDYDQYVKNLKVIEKANKEEAKQLEKIRLEELKKVQEKLSKLENEKSTKEWNEVDKAIDKQNAEKKSLMKKNPPK
jgi:DNA-binding transcriptional MerR regulator